MWNAIGANIGLWNEMCCSILGARGTSGISATAICGAFAINGAMMAAAQFETLRMVVPHAQLQGTSASKRRGVGMFQASGRWYERQDSRWSAHVTNEGPGAGGR